MACPSLESLLDNRGPARGGDGMHLCGMRLARSRWRPAPVLGVMPVPVDLCRDRDRLGARPAGRGGMPLAGKASPGSGPLRDSLSGRWHRAIGNGCGAGRGMGPRGRRRSAGCGARSTASGSVAVAVVQRDPTAALRDVVYRPCPRSAGCGVPT